METELRGRPGKELERGEALGPSGALLLRLGTPVRVAQPLSCGAEARRAQSCSDRRDPAEATRPRGRLRERDLFPTRGERGGYSARNGAVLARPQGLRSCNKSFCFSSPGWLGFEQVFPGSLVVYCA